MDQPSTTPWRRDPGVLAAGLQAWAGARRGPDAVVTDVRTPGSGMSNDTVLFRLDGDEVVARLAPAPDAFPTFPSYDFEFERRVIELVRARTTVPVPEVLHVESSDAFLGVPFMVVRAVAGVVPGDNPPYLIDPDGWFLRGSAQDWRRMERSTVEVLARLHAVGDGDDTAFLRLDGPGDTALARQLSNQRAYYDWVRDGREVPVLARAFAALGATLPANDRSVLNWGDSRPGNIIFRDFEPVAVLDWEMAAVGPPEVDLAWAVFFHRFFADMAAHYGLPPVPAMFDADEMVGLYHQLTGTALDDLRWYLAFAGLRFGIILTRMSLRSIHFGVSEPPVDEDGLMLFKPLLDQLLDQL